jgi:ubiquinol-cytochrome c reductase iron-sulfur subunit
MVVCRFAAQSGDGKIIDPSPGRQSEVPFIGVMSADTMAAGHDVPRRDFLKLVTVATAAIGGAAFAWSLIDTMNPAADVIAAGAPMDIDLSKIAAGQQVIVRWRGTPILIVHRTPAALKTLQDPALIGKLSDPESSVHQQPPYAENWHRSIEPEFAVLVGICTHLGCLPSYMPQPDPSTPAPNWLGGYFCPCHGSKYDLAGRVYSGVPAPYNLPVPPYHFPTKTTVRIGENPTGQVAFELDSVVQM